MVCCWVFGGDEDEQEFCVVGGGFELEEGGGGREGEIWDVGHGCGDSVWQEDDGIMGEEW